MQLSMQFTRTEEANVDLKEEHESIKIPTVQYGEKYDILMMLE